MLKLRQLMLAVGGGLSPSEALEPRLIDILHKYEREVNTLLARARAGSRTRMSTHTFSHLLQYINLLLIL